MLTLFRGDQAESNLYPRVFTHPAVETCLQQAEGLRRVDISKLRTLVEDIIEERVRVRVTCSGDNPTMPELLQARLGEEKQKIGRWKRWYARNRTIFDPLWEVLASRRPGRISAASSSFPVNNCTAKRTAKRKASLAPEPLPPPPEVAEVNAMVSRASLPGETKEEAWDRVHREMRNEVRSHWERDDSPPPSPDRKHAVVIFEDSALFQTQASRVALDPTADLFEVFLFKGDSDGLPAANYAPDFDRNDLFLTNIAQAQRLFAVGREVAQNARRRRQQGYEPIDIETYPALRVVCITFTATAGERWSYITWCLKTELDTFLDDVLMERVRCNDMLTTTIKEVSRQESGHWKKRFRLEVIDDTGGTVSEKSLTTFLAILCEHIDAYSTREPDGFNPRVTTHARHRLIYESGSIVTYRWSCLFQQAEVAHTAACTELDAALTDCADTIATFYTQLYTILPNFTISDERAASEIFAFIPLIEESHHRCERLLAVVMDTLAALRTVESSRRKDLERSYAAAKVRQVRHLENIPAGLQRLYETVACRPIVQYTHYWESQQRYNSVGRALSSILAWHLPKHPAKAVDFMRALVVLLLWVPVEVAEALWEDPFCGLAWPPGPPVVTAVAGSNHVGIAQITRAYHDAQKVAHTDKGGHNDVSSRVNHARALLVQHLKNGSVFLTAEKEDKKQ